MRSMTSLRLEPRPGVTDPGAPPRLLGLLDIEVMAAELGGVANVPCAGWPGQGRRERFERRPDARWLPFEGGRSRVRLVAGHQSPSACNLSVAAERAETKARAYRQSRRQRGAADGL